MECVYDFRSGHTVYILIRTCGGFTSICSVGLYMDHTLK